MSERKDKSMKVLRVFFLGLLYGWYMKWIIDEIFVKDQYRMITNENLRLREQIQSLEASRATELMAAQRPAPRPQLAQPVEPAPAPLRATSEKDDLKLIKGIGLQMEKKLNNAGVHTFEQMSRLTTTDVQNILGISKRVTQNADNLISQARKLALEKPKR
jgi:predicted flap endonuclease-1-like 5' DNA nuclease